MAEEILTMDAGSGAFIYSSAGNTNNGSHVDYFVGDNGSGVKYRAVLVAALASLPARIATIESAVLSLYLTAKPATNRTMYVYRVKRNWVESQVTWNSYSTGNAWSTAGAYDSNDIDTTAIGSIGFTTSETLNAYKNISLDTATILGMYNGTYDNYGWLLKMATESADRVTFNSDNETTNKPKLTVNYTLSTGGRVFQAVIFM